MTPTFGVRPQAAAAKGTRARKRGAQGKSTMNAVGHCMKKALAIVWGVWRSGMDFAAPPSAS
jgi:hypothetical protein